MTGIAPTSAPDAIVTSGGDCTLANASPLIAADNELLSEAPEAAVLLTHASSTAAADCDLILVEADFPADKPVTSGSAAAAAAPALLRIVRAGMRDSDALITSGKLMPSFGEVRVVLLATAVAAWPISMVEPGSAASGAAAAAASRLAAAADLILSSAAANAVASVLEARRGVVELTVAAFSAEEPLSLVARAVAVSAMAAVEPRTATTGACASAAATDRSGEQLPSESSPAALSAEVATRTEAVPMGATMPAAPAASAGFAGALSRTGYSLIAVSGSADAGPSDDGCSSSGTTAEAPPSAVAPEPAALVLQATDTAAAAQDSSSLGAMSVPSLPTAGDASSLEAMPVALPFTAAAAAGSAAGVAGPASSDGVPCASRASLPKADRNLARAGDVGVPCTDPKVARNACRAGDTGEPCPDAGVLASSCKLSLECSSQVPHH